MPKQLKLRLIYNYFISIYRHFFKKRQNSNPAEEPIVSPASSSSSSVFQETSNEKNCKIICNQQLSSRMSQLNTCSHNNAGIYRDFIISLNDWHNYIKRYNIFHFTSRQKADQIRIDQFLKPKKARIVPFKKAVYLTMLSPLENDDVLLENNYKGNLKYRNKLECAFAFDNHMLNASRCVLSEGDYRDVWMVEGQILLYEYDFILIYRQ